MTNFGSILKKGRKIFITKQKGGSFGRCEECNSRARLFAYTDEEKVIWMLCETCITLFTNEEDK
jgi:hypothetical protein